jgi:predicted transcriptional regulator of viral defense system
MEHAAMVSSSDPRIDRLLGRGGTARSQELVAAGLSRSEISRRVAAGTLVRLARGLYALPDYQSGEHGALVEIAKRSPKVVFCLLTALRVHDLTTQSPHEVWIAIGNKDHPPRMSYPRLRTLRFAAESLDAGVETREVDGTTIRITGVAKTVADCFKFRSKVGLDVAIEALREARRGKRATMDDLWRCARIDRVENVMRPYLEALS